MPHQTKPNHLYASPTLTLSPTFAIISTTSRYPLQPTALPCSPPLSFAAHRPHSLPLSLWCPQGSVDLSSDGELPAVLAPVPVRTSKEGLPTDFGHSADPSASLAYSTDLAHSASLSVEAESADLGADGSAYVPEAEWVRQGILPSSSDDKEDAPHAPPHVAVGSNKTLASTWEEWVGAGQTGPGNGGAADQWRLSPVNSSYGMCPSYPTAIVVPLAIDDATLTTAARFRSKARLPILTWRHPNGATLCRSAQPLTGLGDRRSGADEQIIAAVGLASPMQQRIIIADARSKVAATGNAMLGKGTESEGHYLASVVFLDIANIHAVRSSFLKLHELHAHVSSKTASSDYLRALDDTHWLSHLESLLRGAHRLAHCVHAARRSVLVHCSDGWDRTSQVCVLTQLMLDPHYRTLRGLATLLDKDMVACGHKSADRNGHAFGGTTSSEWSPIWLQLLDAIRQLVRQFPAAFEFDERTLAFLATHLYAGYVSTFRHNSPSSRANDASASKLTSVWAQLLARAPHLRNPAYVPWPLERGPLKPACSLQRILVWELFLPPMRYLSEHCLTEASWCHATPPSAPRGKDAAKLAAVANAAHTAAPVIPRGGSRAELGEMGDGIRLSSASVTHASRKADARGAEYHAYHIQVEVETDAPGESVRRFEVCRRFSDFQQLDALLRQKLPPSELSHLPGLPSSLTFNKFSDSVVSTRRAALDRYVRALLASESELAGVPEVLTFFVNELGLEPADALPNMQISLA